MKNKRTDEQWTALLRDRTARLAKFATILAPCTVMEMEFWMVYEAMHRGSKWSMIRSFIKRKRAGLTVGIQYFWNSKVRGRDIDDDDFWI